MTKTLDDDLALLGQGILRMGGLVEGQVDAASIALTQRRADVARKVMAADDEIDRVELEVDEECLRLLALHHPVAGDLRFITAAMKINNDLERIGDLAANVAERALDLATLPPLPLPLQFEPMTRIVRGMLHDALDALVRRDGAQARDVIRRDEEVNAIHRRHFESLQEAMMSDPGTIERAIDLLSASRQLERIADQTKNIAEDVVFLVEARVLRHRRIDEPS
ncbi:MAG TPA: phosphate signaling complex protein PhoU [Planctomycetota bacterium]|nr:phosphate signaling complex protein PhoU [Planctomycetota bacterium]